MNKTVSSPKLLPPTYLLAAVLLMLGLHFLFPITQLIVGLWRLTGILPLILGIIASYMAEGQFRRVGTTVKPFETSSLLVTDGLYRFSRNPMYVGMVLILAGISLLLGSMAPIGILVLFPVLISYQFIQREEQMLATQFGQDWLEYKTQVRRWI